MSLMRPMLIAISLLAGSGTALAGDAHAGHGQPTTSGSEPAVHQVPVDGKRWLADAPLREGMGRVRTATNALTHREHGHLDLGQVQALADEIRSAVQYMFANCRLDSEPDTALHPLLARLLGASQALRDNPRDADVVPELQDVLDRYGKLFDDGAQVTDAQ